MKKRKRLTALKRKANRKRELKKEKRKERRKIRKVAKASSVGGGLGLFIFLVFLLYTGIQLNIAPELQLKAYVSYNVEAEGYNVRYVIESENQGYPEINVDENGARCSGESKQCFTIKDGEIQGIVIPHFFDNSTFWGKFKKPTKKYTKMIYVCGKIINGELIVSGIISA